MSVGRPGAADCPGGACAARAAMVGYRGSRRRVVVLGGGVSGTTVANALRRRRANLDVTLVDSHGDVVNQPTHLHIPFAVRLERARATGRLLRGGIRLVVDHAAGIDLDGRVVHLRAGTALPYDALVLATGARLDKRSLPGFREAAHNFHCHNAAERLRERLEDFAGGDLVVGAAAEIYRCPYAVPEFALLLDGWLRSRRLRGKTRLHVLLPEPLFATLGPLGEELERLLLEAGACVRAPWSIASMDPRARSLHAADGAEQPFDLLVLVPPHRGAPFLAGSSLVDSAGWVAVDPRTLRARGAAGVFALGDAARLPAPKLGSAAHFQAAVVVEQVLAELDGRPSGARYDGRARHLVHVGGGRALRMESTYAGFGRVRGPSLSAYVHKVAVERLFFEFAGSSLQHVV
ncbi:MAG: FAD-dependent oxidoreductase [Deltaproteobacteria bacterium]|nr:FAD-dependent oxidoreductase [Deltaproteobacteria bacterium]